MKKILFIAALFFFISTPISGYADWPSEQVKEKAQKAIDTCWAISLEDRDSGVTTRMRSGALDSALCMEKHIVELSQKYLFKNNPDKVQRVKEDLEKFRSGYGHLQWMLYNEIDSCFEGINAGCGTMYHSVHNSAYAKSLEDVILRFYGQIEAYDLQKD